MRRGALHIAVAGSVAVAVALAVWYAPAASVEQPGPAPTAARFSSAFPSPATPSPAALSASAPAGSTSPSTPADTGFVIVRLKRDLSPRELRRLGLEKATRLRGSTTLLASPPAGVTADEFSERLESSESIASAGPDHLFAPAYSGNPNDPAFLDLSYRYVSGGSIPFGKSWALRGSGSRFTEVWPGLDFPSADRDAVRVAVIDTGFYLNHPDAQSGSIVGAVDECATYTVTPGGGVLSIDDDVTPVNEDTPGTDRETSAHGTMVAGQIGQNTSNGYGSAGAAWDTWVDVYKVQGVVSGGALDGKAVIPESAIANAIRDAVDDAHARGHRLVINMSLVMISADSEPEDLRDAIEYARLPEHDVVIVAAAGNDAEATVGYPAAFDGVIGVGAASFDGTDLARSSFSNWGSALDLMAPGDDIWGPTKPGVFVEGHTGYAWWRGTSMASPFVAAAAALLIRAEPSLAATETVAYLTGTAADMGPAGRDDGHGWGMLDVSAAYRLLVTPRTTSDAVSNYADSATIRFTVADRDSGADTTTYYQLDNWGVAEGTVMSTTGEYEDQKGFHELTYWSVDANGVEEEPHTITFRIGTDDSAPITTSDAHGAYSGVAAVTLFPSDPAEDDWGIASTWYRVDGGAEASGTRPTVASSGPHVLEYWSVDRAGNVEEANTATFTVTPLTTKATVARSPHYIRRGSHVHLSGTLTNARVGDTVSLWVKGPGSSVYTREYKRTVTKVSKGIGTWSPLTYKPKKRGIYYFRVLYAGDNKVLSRTAYKSSGVHTHVR